MGGKSALSGNICFLFSLSRSYHHRRRKAERVADRSAIDDKEERRREQSEEEEDEEGLKGEGYTYMQLPI